MNVFKLKVLTCSGDHEQSYLKDLYLNVDVISGFYIPEKHEEDEHIEGEFITLIHDGHWTNVLQEPHIVKYLTDNFVNKSI